MRNLINGYFNQGIQYYSESGKDLIEIRLMAPAYAANAARRLLIDALIWKLEATGETKFPARWMMNTKLWRALMARAQGDATQDASVYRDSNGDIWVRNSGGGWRVSGDTDRSDMEFMSLEKVERRWGPLTAISI